MPPNGTDFKNAVSNFEFIGRTFNEVGTHSLVITPLIPGAFFLDYIIVESPTAFFPPKAQIAAVPEPAETKSIQPAGPSSTNLVLPETTSSARLDAGAVAAIVLGIFLGFVLVFVGWYSLRHRQKIGERWRSENGRRSGVFNLPRNNFDLNSFLPRPRRGAWIIKFHPLYGGCTGGQRLLEDGSTAPN
jgi:hypothetical protein